MALQAPKHLKAILTISERIIFVDALYAARMRGEGWKGALASANKKLPENRQLENSIDHPNKITWVKTMLEAKAKGANTMETVFAKSPSIAPVLPKTPSLPKENHTSSLPLDLQEKFVKSAYQFKKTNPIFSWKKCFDEARKVLPDPNMVHASLNHPNQYKWIATILEKLGKADKKSAPLPTSKSKQDKYTPTPIVLTPEEKLAFVTALLAYKKSNPLAKWPACIDAGRVALPEDRQIGKKIAHPSQLPWILPLMDKQQKAESARKMLDLRKPLVPPEVTQEKPPALEQKVNGRKNTPRTHLSPDEKMLFAEALYRLRIANAGIGWEQLLVQANQELPGHRQLHATPHSPSQLPWLPPLLSEIAKRLPEPVQSESFAPIPQIEESKETPMADMRDDAANALASLVLQNLPALMKSQKFQNAFANGLAQTSQPVAKQQNGVKADTRPKVMVVGLLSIQTQDIQKEYGKIFDLRFFDQNVPSQQIKESAKSCTIAILMTKFIPHTVQAALRGHPGFAYCNGNQSALKQLLQEKMIQLGIS